MEKARIIRAFSLAKNNAHLTPESMGIGNENAFLHRVDGPHPRVIDLHLISHQWEMSGIGEEYNPILADIELKINRLRHVLLLVGLHTIEENGEFVKRF